MKKISWFVGASLHPTTLLPRVRAQFGVLCPPRRVPLYQLFPGFTAALKVHRAIPGWLGPTNNHSKRRTPGGSAHTCSNTALHIQLANTRNYQVTVCEYKFENMKIVFHLAETESLKIIPFIFLFKFSMRSQIISYINFQINLDIILRDFI